jgi:hypothetical protein
VRTVSYKMLYLCTLPNTTCGGERRELSEFRESWEPALWVTLWAETKSTAAIGPKGHSVPAVPESAKRGSPTHLTIIQNLHECESLPASCYVSGCGIKQLTPVRPSPTSTSL